jgi:hypothetical protein
MGEVVGKATYQTDVDQSGLHRGIAEAESKLKSSGDQVEQRFGAVGNAAEQAGGRLSRFGDVGKGAVMGVGLAVGNMVTSFAMNAPIQAMEAVGNAIQLAGDKAESASKAQALFGDSYSLIEAASKNATDTVNMSSGAYLAAAGDLGNLVTNLGFAGDEAAHMSVDMLQLAADVGSFNNASPQEVVQAMGAAFRGETEPIRRFGVMLNEAAIQQEAVKMGLVSTTKEFAGLDFATQQNIKAQATYSLILSGTAAAHGDVAKTADSLANVQQRSAARTEEAWTNLGEKLVPLAAMIVPMLADAVVGLVDVITTVTEAVQNWVAENRPLVDTLMEFARFAFDVWLGAWQAIIGVVGELGYRLGGFIGLVHDVLGAIVALGTAVVKVFEGDFEGAAYEAEQAMSRIGSAGDNLQRVMGDQSRRRLDQIHAEEQESARVWQQQVDTMRDTVTTGYASMYGAASRSVQDHTRTVESEADQQAAAVAGGVAAQRQQLEAMADAAGVSLGQIEREWRRSGVDLTSIANKTAQEQAAAVRRGAEESVRAAAWGGEQTPRAYADGVRSQYSQPVSAMEKLKQLMKDTLSPVQKEAELIGILTSKRLANALDDGRPEVRGEAQQIALDSIRELAKLNPEAKEIGAMTTRLLASATASERPALRSAIAQVLETAQTGLSGLPELAYNAGLRAANRLEAGFRPDIGPMLRDVRRQVQLGSPAEIGPWSEQGGPEAWMADAGRRMHKAFTRELGKPVRPPVLDLTTSDLSRRYSFGTLGMPSLAPGITSVAGASATVHHEHRHSHDLTSQAAAALREVGYNESAVAEALTHIIHTDSARTTRLVPG